MKALLFDRIHGDKSKSGEPTERTNSHRHHKQANPHWQRTYAATWITGTSGNVASMAASQPKSGTRKKEEEAIYQKKKRTK